MRIWDVAIKHSFSLGTLLEMLGEISATFASPSVQCLLLFFQLWL